MEGELLFRINGEEHSLTRRQVESALRGTPPESVRDHGVKINGQIYPVKQALAVATGLDRLDFQSAQARSVLRRLGFDLWRSGSR